MFFLFFSPFYCEQIDVASLIDEQVKKQMKTVAKEQQQLRELRSRRKLPFAKGWNWPSSPNRKQSMPWKAEIQSIGTEKEVPQLEWAK